MALPTEGISLHMGFGYLIHIFCMVKRAWHEVIFIYLVNKVCITKKNNRKLLS